MPDATLTAAFDWATLNGRGGKGTPCFVASGNAASGYSGYSVSGFSTGNWTFERRYSKDASGTSGSDTAWLANVQFPNGSSQRFDAAGPGLPAGWSTSGSASWTVVDDPTHAYGTGRYEAKAGTITHSQATVIRSPTIAVSGTGTMTWRAWVSSQASSDFFRFYDSDQRRGHVHRDPVVRQERRARDDVGRLVSGQPGQHDCRGARAPTGTIAPTTPSSADAGLRGAERWRISRYTDHRPHRIDGYNTSSDYTTTGTDGFSGTSSATPLAAGVGAAIVEESGTTASDVRTPMRNTAAKIGGNNGASAYDGSGFNTYYGYGRIDAAAALPRSGRQRPARPFPLPCSRSTTCQPHRRHHRRYHARRHFHVRRTHRLERQRHHGHRAGQLSGHSRQLPGDGHRQADARAAGVTQHGQYTVTFNGTTSFEDQAGNPLNGGSDSVYNFTLDTAAPAAGNVTSAKPDGTYKAFAAIDVTVDFSETVLVTGTPRLEFETGATDRTANYLSGSGTATLTFRYTVQPGDASADLDYTSATAWP